MNRTLLDYYERELGRFRKDGEGLARSGQNRANALQNLYASGDPFVKQLVQAFAYTHARMELKIDSERDRVPSALLQLLHPSICRPIPPRTIVQFNWGNGEVEREGKIIEANTALKLTDDDKVPFRTVGKCILPAVELKSVQLLAMSEREGTRQRLRLNLQSPRPANLKLSQVQLRLPNHADGFPLNEKDPRNFGLRLFLGGAESEASFAIYHALTLFKITGELLVKNVCRKRITDCVRAGGFDSTESLLPTDSRQLEPMRLMAEYALMRDKFLFIDVVGLDPDSFKDVGESASLDLLLEPETATLIDRVKQTMRLRLGCVPAVNLKTESLKTMPLHHRANEFSVAVEENNKDAVDKPLEKEIFSIDEVRASRWGQTELEYLEMFRPLPARLESRRERAGYWHGRRVSRLSGEAGIASSTSETYDDENGQFHGSDLLLSLMEFKPEQTLAAGRALQILASCFNRDVKELIGRPLRFTSEAGPCEAVCDLYPAVAPNLQGSVVLRVVEHLSCGVGLLQSWGDPRAAVARFLALFKDIYPSVVGTQFLLSDAFITKLDVKPTAAPLAGGIARGVKLEMEVDPGNVSIHEAYLLLRVLEVALSAYCSSGGFVQLTVRYKDGRETREIACPARIGKIALI